MISALKLVMCKSLSAIVKSLSRRGDEPYERIERGFIGFSPASVVVVVTVLAA